MTHPLRRGGSSVDEYDTFVPEFESAGLPSLRLRAWDRIHPEYTPSSCAPLAVLYVLCTGFVHVCPGSEELSLRKRRRKKEIFKSVTVV